MSTGQKVKVIYICRATAYSAVVAGLLGASACQAQGPFFPTYPSFPVVVTPPALTGVNPFTGGVNTGGSTINNTVFDPWRNSSMGNGSMRPVNRPVYNAFGQIVGWETGVEWNNQVTGQLHGNTQIVSPNGLGGVHTQHVMKGRPGQGTQGYKRRSRP